MPSLHELVRALGPHPASAPDSDLRSDAGLWRWLLRACLGDAPEDRAAAALAALEAEGATSPAHLADADPARLALRLGACGLTRPRPDRVAGSLVRAARSLVARHDGSLTALLRGADDLESAGEALVGLAPGIGAATALRFLRPLRDGFDAARDAPLAPAALAAAACLGWIDPDADPESALGALRRRARDAPDGPPLRDVEAALERLGAAACRRGRAARCPLAEACPLRYSQGP